MNIRFQEAIPTPKKPLGINLDGVELEWRVVSASDEHYAPAINVISPFAPINMFDGMESKRSRTLGHKEELIIESKSFVEKADIEFDFKYFVNNNPKELMVSALQDGEWKVIHERVNCKAYAGNVMKIKGLGVHSNTLKFNFFPDGGVNRIRVKRFV